MTTRPGRFHRLLASVVELKPGEDKIVILLFFYFFLINAAYSIIKSLRVASYLESLGADKLPLAYLLTAILIGFVVALHSRLQASIPRVNLIIFSLTFFILSTLIFWFLFSFNWTWLPLAYYVWANVFLAVTITQFWIVVNDLFNPREAKRLVGLFGSGGILGGIFGGEATGLLARSNVDYGLLLMASGFLVTCIPVVYLLAGQQKRKQGQTPRVQPEPATPDGPPCPMGFQDCLKTVRSNRYLQLMAAGITLSLVVSTFIDWQFNKVVEGASALENRLTSFYGHFNAGLLVLAFFVQIFLTSRFIQRFGLRLSFLIYPLVLVGVLTGLAILPASLLLALTLKGTDKSLSYTLNQSVRELLYIPVSPDIKYKAKVFIDMFLNRFAKGMGAIMLLALLSFRPGLRLISLVTIFLILAWVVIKIRVTREYSSVVKKKLKKKWERADRVVTEQVDLDYIKLVFDAIENQSRSQELFAMDLFDLRRQDKLNPELKRLIAARSGAVSRTSLATLFEEEVAPFPDWPWISNQESFKQEVEEILADSSYRELLKNYINRVLAEKKPGTEVARMEAARIIGLMRPNSLLAEELTELLEDESREVSRLAMDSASRTGDREYVHTIIRKLKEPSTREDATRSLLNYGSRIAGTLSDYLGDETEDLELKRAIISVLSRLATQEAADFLAMELPRTPPELDYELIDALDRMRSINPEISLPVETVRLKLISEVKKYCQVFTQAQGQLEPNQEQQLAGWLVSIFQLLGFIYHPDDISRAYQNLKTGTKDAAAYALELLENILIKADKDLLWPLLEDLTPAERLKKMQAVLVEINKDQG
ncbi:MAG: NTP/NDP exchange transporter [Candidatus Saccharicenans sp.]|uniref:NTP/NDP exchange transporter n=1 Tax=Candidatus Saccharicenans sp. TaxID=2819258 RepID=UPI00404AC4A5